MPLLKAVSSDQSIGHPHSWIVLVVMLTGRLTPLKIEAGLLAACLRRRGTMALLLSSIEHNNATLGAKRNTTGIPAPEHGMGVSSFAA